MDSPFRCALCGRPIDNVNHCYREMTGWAAPRQQGGTNALRKRSETGRLAHVSCIVGRPAGQESLL